MGVTRRRRRSQSLDSQPLDDAQGQEFGRRSPSPSLGSPPLVRLRLTLKELGTRIKYLLVWRSVTRPLSFAVRRSVWGVHPAALINPLTHARSLHQSFAPLRAVLSLRWAQRPTRSRDPNESEESKGRRRSLQATPPTLALQPARPLDAGDRWGDGDRISGLFPRARFATLSSPRYSPSVVHALVLTVVTLDPISVFEFSVYDATCIPAVCLRLSHSRTPPVLIIRTSPSRPSPSHHPRPSELSHRQRTKRTLSSCSSLALMLDVVLHRSYGRKFSDSDRLLHCF